MKAPDFVLEDQDGKKTSLSDFKGKWAVLYFYPKDDTPGCTTEARDFTRLAGDFRREGAEIIGVSPDTVDSHCKFIKKHDLGITLLSDPEKTVLEKYGAWGRKKFMGREYDGVIRSTFLIDPEVNIAHSWPSVKTKGHAEEVLSKLKEMKS